LYYKGNLTLDSFKFWGDSKAYCNLLGLYLTKKVSSSLDMRIGMTLAKLATHFCPPMRTSSPSICSLLMPADGEVADEIMTLRIPVM